jgi:phosphatidate cytidylyltransferase
LKTRVISGAVAFILLIAVIFLGKQVFALVFFTLTLIGVHELYQAFSKAGFKPIKLIGYIWCLLVPFEMAYGTNFWGIADAINKVGINLTLALIIFITLLIMFSLVVFAHDKYNVIDIAITFLGIAYIVFLFSFLSLTRNMINGEYYIWLVFIGAWATDTCAYFTGVLLGRTKLLPAISPKKTLEGSIGGVVGCMLISLLYGWYIISKIDGIAIYHFAIIGLLCGVISQIGDWTASAIKRYAGIKDYGKLMPGHGGVLDRFDSILFVAPVIYFYINLILNIA